MMRLLLACFILFPEAAAFSMKIIDSHLHVWADKEAAESFPYDQVPPESLQNIATPEALLEQMNKAKVDGALIVQPINHKYAIFVKNFLTLLCVSHLLSYMILLIQKILKTSH